MIKSIVVLVTLALATHVAAADKLVVVVAKSSPLTNISKHDLKRSFLGEPVEAGGVKLAPFNAEPSSDARAGFDLAVLGMSVDQAGRYWVDRKVRGQGAAPRSMPAVHLAKVVAKFPGAISYLRVDQLTPDVKPIKVDGVAYDDARYTIGSR
jgi:ABC-type phosphate transport system substrate-binding protein